MNVRAALAEAIIPLRPETQVERERREALVRLRRTGTAAEIGLFSLWIVSSGALTGAVVASFSVQTMVSAWLIFGNLLGLTFPLAAWGMRRLKGGLAQERLRLDPDVGANFGHLSAALRANATEARMLASAVEGDVGSSDLPRAIWEWCEAIDHLEGGDRSTLDELGLTSHTVRDAVFGERALLRFRGTLSPQQKQIVADQLRRFERTLANWRGGPYR